MRSIRRKAIWLGGAGAAGVLALGLAVPSLANAADPSPSPSASASTGSSDRDARRAAHQDELATALARELGIDKAKVAAALAKVEADERANHAPPANGTKPDRTADLKSRLEQAVKDGKLTQAEADAIQKAAQAGVLFGGHPGR